MGRPKKGCEPSAEEVFKNKKKREQKFYTNNPEYGRFLHIKQRYKLTKEQYLKRLAEQENKCAICETLESDTVRKRLFVDHNHACCSGDVTCGKCVRDLLCDNCNKMLANAKESVATLLRGVDYLRKFDLTW